MASNHYPISRTTTGPGPENLVPAPGHADDQHFDFQHAAGSSRPQAASAPEIRGYNKPVDIDDEQIRNHESQGRPNDAHYHLNSSAEISEQELLINDGEEIVAAVLQHGQGEADHLQKETGDEQLGLSRAVCFRISVLTS